MYRVHMHECMCMWVVWLTLVRVTCRDEDKIERRGCRNILLLTFGALFRRGPNAGPLEQKTWDRVGGGMCEGPALDMRAHIGASLDQRRQPLHLEGVRPTQAVLKGEPCALARRSRAW